MKSRKLALQDLLLIEGDWAADERGAFTRIHCRKEFESLGIPEMVQSSLSLSHTPGTLRGMHFQVNPSKEAKLVRCINGRLLDVVVDVRPQSPTFREHVAFELEGGVHNALYIPSGFAHGFQTLEPSTLVLYQMTDYYAPELGDGFRWNDPSIGIEWPLEVTSISDRDANYDDFETLDLSGFIEQ